LSDLELATCSLQIRMFLSLVGGAGTFLLLRLANDEFPSPARDEFPIFVLTGVVVVIPNVFLEDISGKLASAVVLVGEAAAAASSERMGMQALKSLRSW